uniref:Uncharacterized protein n=1 Tax=Anguilla anguilla TaxID=7936 RepID=A0A0E9UH38_ANGAN
MNSFCFFQV